MAECYLKHIQLQKLHTLDENLKKLYEINADYEHDSEYSKAIILDGRLVVGLPTSKDVFETATIYVPELREGESHQVYTTRYERNPVARNRCIELKGCKCSICGFDFEKTYGEIGKGFIHVHHIVPVSEIGESYRVDYEKDLIPVCPNCHAMLHRKGGSVEGLKEIINNK